LVGLGVAEVRGFVGAWGENACMAIEINSTVVDTPPLPSATVMVVRDAGSAQGLEVLMMRRHANSGVLGGAHVFPGGKVDPADQAALGESLWDASPQVCRSALNEPDLADGMVMGLYAAALRETFEECGLVLGAPPLAQAGAVGRIRQAMSAGSTDFVAAMRAVGGPWAASGLLPWSRWITPRVPSMMSKRFDTRFFLAVAPHGQDTRHCERETTEAVWLTPRHALERAWAREIELAPPQIMSLAHLARLGSVDAALAWARANPPPRVAPEPFDDNGERVICYPGDASHSQPGLPWPGSTTRLVFRNGRFEAPGGLAALLGDTD
jgi:8-oxo-dGTP pyrophosphatase MutT (NUDIX family)